MYRLLCVPLSLSFHCPTWSSSPPPPPPPAHILKSSWKSYLYVVCLLADLVVVEGSRCVCAWALPASQPDLPDHHHSLTLKVTSQSEGEEGKVDVLLDSKTWSAASAAASAAVVKAFNFGLFLLPLSCSLSPRAHLQFQQQHWQPLTTTTTTSARLSCRQLRSFFFVSSFSPSFLPRPFFPSSSLSSPPSSFAGEFVAAASR